MRRARPGSRRDRGPRHRRQHGVRRPPHHAVRRSAGGRVHDGRRCGQRGPCRRSRCLVRDRRRLAPGVAAAGHHQYDPADRLSRHACRPGPRHRDDDRGQVGRAGGSGRAQPLFADHRHGHRHGPVLSGGSARPRASRKGVDQSPRQAGRAHRDRGQGIGRRGVALAERPRGFLHARPVFTPWAVSGLRRRARWSGWRSCCRPRATSCSTRTGRRSSSSRASARRPTALAAVLDRVACGTIPEGLSQEALRCQAACVACALAGRPEAWPAFRSELMEGSDAPIDLVLRAIAARLAGEVGRERLDLTGLRRGRRLDAAVRGELGVSGPTAPVRVTRSGRATRGRSEWT